MILVGYEFRFFKIGIMKFKYIVYYNGFILCFKKIRNICMIKRLSF